MHGRRLPRLIDIGRIDMVQVDLTRCGLTQAMTIAALAEARGLPVIDHNFTTDINVAASLHFLASVPNAFIMEYCVEPSEISRPLAMNPIPIVNGHAAVPEEPGLGVEPDPAIIEKYLVRASTGPCGAGLTRLRSHQPGLAVVAFGAGMERGGQRRARHLAPLELGERRVQALELLKILEHRLDHQIDHVVGRVGRGHQGRPDPEGRDRAVVASIQPARDRRWAK